jgi:hypothetical protein
MHALSSGMHSSFFLRPIVLLSVASPALQNFSTLPYKWHDVQKHNIEHKLCVLIFSTNCV